MAKNLKELSQEFERLNVKTLGLRNRKQKLFNSVSDSELENNLDNSVEYKNHAEETFLFSINPTTKNKSPSVQDLPAYNEPPKNTRVFEQYPLSTLEQMVQDISGQLLKQGKKFIDNISSNFAVIEKSMQELSATFSKDEKQFINSIVSQSVKHHGIQNLISIFNINPVTAALIGLATLPFIKKATAQPVPGTDFAMYDGFPSDGINLCENIAKENLEQCKQFYVTYNDNTVIQSVSKLIKGPTWGEGRIKMQELCVDPFNQCRDQAAMKSIMEKMLQDPNVTKFIDSLTPCFDKSNDIGRCSSTTTFKGLSGAGCKEVLGWDRNSSISKFTICLDGKEKNITEFYKPCKPGDTSFECKPELEKFGIITGISLGALIICGLLLACDGTKYCKDCDRKCNPSRYRM